jgi:hypothetical protein
MADIALRDELTPMAVEDVTGQVLLIQQVMKAAL